MKKITKFCVTALFVGAFAFTSSADIVGFWHTGANSVEPYTGANINVGDLAPTETFTNGGPYAYGGLSLALDAASTQFKLTCDSDSMIYLGAPLLTSVGNITFDNMLDNGVRCDTDVNGGAFTHVLSGLSIGQQYQLQFTTTLRYAVTPSAFRTETVTLTTDVGTAVATANSQGTSSSVRDFLVASDYLEWTAAATSLNLNFVSTGSTDDKILTGIIVNAVPEPTTTGLLGLGAISLLLIRRFKSRA
jgi:hypothetical protein